MRCSQLASIVLANCPPQWSSEKLRAGSAVGGQNRRHAVAQPQLRIGIDLDGVDYSTCGELYLNQSAVMLGRI